MQSLKSEISEYKKFIENDFAKFGGMALFEQNAVPIRNVYRALGMCEISVDYDYLSENVRAEFKRIQLSLLNFLVALPCGNELFITAITRQISEEILRVVYMIHISDSVDGNSRLSFRHLWLDGIKKTDFYQESTKEKIVLDKVAHYFGDNSVKLHNVTSGNTTKLSGYLQNLVEECQISSTTALSNELNTLCKAVYQLLPVVCDIDSDKMTMPQKATYKFIS